LSKKLSDLFVAQGLEQTYSSWEMVAFQGKGQVKTQKQEQEQRKMSL
jgi:hypothetical protein